MYRQAREQYAAQGLEVLGIIYEDTADNARRFMAREGAGWPALVDANGSVARAYRVTAIPTTYFVDRGGVIRDASYGPPPQDALTAYIRQILR
jgi:cytochrome c biogenesis protein CcmG, thiol:disulfide interchange protein DsbE